jgi:Mg/Co/Ni transporter MgtE
LWHLAVRVPILKEPKQLLGILAVDEIPKLLNAARAGTILKVEPGG